MPVSSCGECNVLEHCAQSDIECQAYQEALYLHESGGQNNCKQCFNYSYCTGSEEDCEGFQNSYVTGKDSGSSGTLETPANKGLVNWVSGPIVNIMTGDYMALVSIQTGEHLMTSMLPRSEFETLGYKQGDIITMAVKAVNVKVMR